MMKEMIVMMVVGIVIAALVVTSLDQRASCVQQMVAGGSAWCEAE